MWLRKLNLDAELTAASLRVANMFLLDFDYMCKGSARYSHQEAEEVLGLSRQTVWRAFKQLTERRWLTPTNQKDCYRPGPGPLHA
jgi:DNA-binding IclR family transcriptional regulator